MSLQHSQQNHSGFMHSATALVWQITLPCHFHTSMSPKSLNFQYRRIYNCQSDKEIKNYHLERPMNGQNMIVQHVYKCDQFTGTIQKMIISNKMNTEKN